MASRFAFCGIFLLLCLYSALHITQVAFASSTPNEEAEKTVPVDEKDVSDFMTEEDKSKLASSKEKHEFQAEVNRLMDIIINSLYTKRDVSLRELLSNAADALEIVRFSNVAAKEKGEDISELPLQIFVGFDKNAKTISITDTGVGMTKQDLINNLGTVAKSGTSNFLESLAKAGDVNLIGQFGVGFYAAFLIADKVTVTSKHSDDEQYVWESSADGSYTVAKDPRGSTLGRGTRITLHLKEDATDFLNESKLKELAGNYGKFISFPIYVKTEKTVTEDVPVEGATDGEEGKKEGDVEVKDDEDEEKEEKKEEKPKTKKVEKTVSEWALVNPDKAIWMRPKEEVEEKQYIEFYKSISKDWQDPLAYTHFSAEGEIEFKAILYIPSRAPSDMFESYFGTQGGNIKLYVRGAFVGDKFENILPKYLNFVKGVVGSDDAPLNVSREQLQHTKLMNVVSKRLVKKFLERIRQMSKDTETQKADMLKKIEEEADEEKKKELKKKAKEPAQFDKFWKEFSKNMKLGCYDDDSNRSKIAKILRFHTSKSGDNQITLDKYLENAKPDEKSIYYISGESSEQLLKSPHMQVFLKKDIEVLFLTEAMDEPCIQRLTDYEGKKFVSISKGQVEFEQSEEEKKKETKLKKMYDPLLKWFQGELGGKVQKVELSRRLVSDPCAVVASQWGYSPHMEKLMKSQTFADASQVRMMANQKVFEINPNHPIMVNLLSKVKANKNDQAAKEIAEKLFQAALAASGFELEAPNKFAKIIYDAVSDSIGVDPHADVQEVNVDDVEDEEEAVKGDDDDAADDETEDLDAEEKEEKTDDEEKGEHEDSKKEDGEPAEKTDEGEKGESNEKKGDEEKKAEAEKKNEEKDEL